MLTFDEVVGLVGRKPKPLLVAIDGLPLSGKTTLVLRLMNELGAECVQLGDFVKPEAEWPSRDTASFPLDYIRYDEFVSAVRFLAQNRGCRFNLYDSETGRTADEPKCIRGDGIAIVEGVSALHPDLSPYYDLRIWVESDANTTLAASLQRGVGSGVTNGSSCSSLALNSISRPTPRLGLTSLRAVAGCIKANSRRSAKRPVA